MSFFDTEVDYTDAKVKDFVVSPCTRQEIEYFIEQWHYSKSINGVNSEVCFKLTYDHDIIGAALFGKFAMHNQYKKFVENEEDVIELRRLCCIDATPRNTESYFIGAMLRYLKANTTFKKVVSYADSEYGHQGTIYKASNFTLLSLSKGDRVIMFNGKKFHDKSIRNKHNGVLKPFAQRLVYALETGEAQYETTSGKYCYEYVLRG